MPKLVCNGFSMFSNYVRISLEEERGRKFGGLDKDLIEAAGPLWENLSAEEKKTWKERAKKYKKTDEFVERKRQVRAKRSPNPRQSKKKDDDEEGDDSLADLDIDNAEDSIGVPIARSPTPLPLAADTSSTDNGNQDQYDVKRHADAAKLTDFLKRATGGTLKDIKRCRFLFLSVQTYGHLDDLCIPAELSLVEFSLAKGIIDECVAVLGDWPIPLHLIDKAKCHADASHKIPLEKTFRCPNYMADKTELLKQLLGRLEPGIARSQDICMGLYTKGLVEFEDEPDELSASDSASASCHASGGRSTPERPLLPGDVHGRRWVICLSNEMPTIIDALTYVARQQNIDYAGIPCEADRFIFLDTFVDTMAQFVSASPVELGSRAVRTIDKGAGDACGGVLASGGGGGTVWDEQDQVFCALHKPEHNLHCAFATCVRACFAAFFSLRECYSLPFTNY